MTRRFVVLCLAVCLGMALPGTATGQASPPRPGILLQDLTWQEAEQVLTPQTVVVIPLGAAAKEHGPHLKLKNDLILADYLTRRVLDAATAVVAPTVTYHFYPSFLEYPGSTSLQRDTARDLVADIVRSLAAFGPRRFYVLNTGISTVRALRPTAEILAQDGILLRFTDLAATLEPIEKQISQQPGGTHADEIETSMVLYIDPASVDMSKAVKDYDATGRGPLSRTQGKPDTTYSPTGIWGDPTLATREKGRIVVEAWVAGVLRDIEETRVADLPLARGRRDAPRAAPAPLPAPASAGAPVAMMAGPSRGRAQDERAIRELTERFATAWNNLDSWGVAQLWTPDGHVAHEDGVVERGRMAINQARATMFARREYRWSRHDLSAGELTFAGPDVAIATGRWSLVNVRVPGREYPDSMGLAAFTFRKTPDEGWLFLALQYVERERGLPPPMTHVQGIDRR